MSTAVASAPRRVFSPAQRLASEQNALRAHAVSVAHSRARAAARLEGLEFLASLRTPREEAACRVGFPTTSALERFLRRQGRSDLLQTLPPERSTS